MRLTWELFRICVLGYLRIVRVVCHYWNHRVVMFRHSKLFLLHFYYAYIILKKSRFILKGLRYRLVLIFDISTHPLKSRKTKPYNAVGFPVVFVVLTCVTFNWRTQLGECSRRVLGLIRERRQEELLRG